MSISLRKHVSTFVVAAVTAGTMALVMGGSPADANHVGSVRYQKGSRAIDVPPSSDPETGGFVLIRTKCPNSHPRVIGGGFTTPGGGPVQNSVWPAAGNWGAGSRYWAQWIRNDFDVATTVRGYAICVHGGVSRNFPNGSNPLSGGASITSEGRGDR